MNKDEIKKAFDICFSAQKSCNGCPLLVLEKQNGRGCKYNLFTSVFDIITEQEKEINNLKDNYAKLQELFAQYQMASDKEIRAQVKQAKIDVLNELKAKSYVNDYCREVVELEKIDAMIEEVQNAEDDK